MKLCRSRYRVKIIAKIGQGGQAEVFLGSLDSGAPRDLVAVKTFASLDFFEREQQILAILTHPLIIRLYGSTINWGSKALVCEYSPGVNLAILLDTWARAFDKLSYLGVLYLAHEMLEALGYLESQAIVHGDLAAENILVSPDASLKLCDFAAAMWTHEPRGLSLGRRNLVAPEVLQGYPLTRWSDLYALGSILFEIVTKERFCRDNPVLNRFMLRSYLGADERRLYYLISSCLKSSPWQRPASAAVAKARLTLSEQEKNAARQELSSWVAPPNLLLDSCSQTYVDFFPTAYF